MSHTATMSKIFSFQDLIIIKILTHCVMLSKQKIKTKTLEFACITLSFNINDI